MKAQFNQRNVSKYFYLVLSVLCSSGALYLFTLCGANAVAAVVVWGLSFVAIIVPGIVAASGFHGTNAVQTCLEIIFGILQFVLIALVSSIFSAGWLMRTWVLLSCTLLGTSILLKLDKQNGFIVRFNLLPNISSRINRLFDTPGGGGGIKLLSLSSIYVLLNAVWAVRYVHPQMMGEVVPSQDFFWNLGNAQSFLLGFPLADLRVDGVTVTYHYLTELYQAALMMAFHEAQPYDIVAFYSYAPLAFFLVLGLYHVGNVLWDKCASCHRRSIILAAMPLWMCCASLWKALENGGSRFGNSLALHTLSNINGQATAFLFLALFLAMFHHLDHSNFRTSAMVYIGAISAFYLLAFSKSPQAGVVAIAVLCTALFMFMRKDYFRLGLVVFCALVFVGFLMLYRFYFAAGANSSMRFSITGTVSLYYFSNIMNTLKILLPSMWIYILPIIWLFQTFLAAPAGVMVWGITAIKDVKNLRAVPAIRLLCHACIVGGTLAFFLFDHYSSSQIYFFNLALFCVGIILIDQFAFHSPQKRFIENVFHKTITFLLGVGLVTFFCLLIWLFGSIADYIGESLPESDGSRITLTASDEYVAEIMHQNMASDELFATNRMHSGYAYEGLSNLYSGLSGRRAWMESFKYAVSNMGERAGDVVSRYDLMMELFDEDTRPERARQICDDNKITWIVFCPRMPGSEISLSQFQTVYKDEFVTLYHVE